LPFSVKNGIIATNKERTLMRLYEEYFKRNSIAVPIVKPINAGTIITRNKSTVTEWTLLHISLKQRDHHPDFYNCKLYRPIHNGDGSKKQFSIESEKILEVNEWEDYLIDFVKNNKEKIIKTETEATIALWEMFIYIFDTSFAGFINISKQEDMLFKTINQELTFKERSKAIIEIVGYLEKHYDYSYLASTWKSNFNEPYIRSYCGWISEFTK
jgi:hypothetical protein